MKTAKRLDGCYRTAKVIEFDDQDKFIFFSDVHRGDNSMSDEFAHNQNIYLYALNHYLEEGYTYFELGDGDELWEHAKFELIRSAHRDVYRLLQKFYLLDRLYLLFGNHNVYLRNPKWLRRHFSQYYDDYHEERTDLFKGITVHESLRLKYRPTGQEFLLVHGHQGDAMNDQFWYLSMLANRFFWRYFHVLGLRNPSSPSKNRVKRHKIEIAFSRWIKQHQVAIICGHTHRTKLPKVHEIPYFNTGCCIHPRGISGIEIHDGQIELVHWRVEADKSGLLRTVKRSIRKPRAIKKYQF